MSDSINWTEKNSDFKLSKQQQFVYTYAEHFQYDGTCSVGKKYCVI